jgi:hypothetical protein
MYSILAFGQHTSRVLQPIARVTGATAAARAKSTRRSMISRLALLWTMVVLVVSTASRSDAELITNGDFSLGNVDFASDYTFRTDHLHFDEFGYVIDTNPHNWTLEFPSVGDHSTGTGNMMVINGATVPDVRVWFETVSVVENQQYTFSAWVMSLTPRAIASLQFDVGGAVIGTAFNAPTTTGIW